MTIQGQILRRSERRETAIYLRDGALWVADFIDGEGQLVDPAAWLRFNCGGTSSTQGALADGARIGIAALRRARRED